MSLFDYDKTSVESIVDYAKLLTGKSLYEVIERTEKFVSKLSRGAIGNMVEELYFGYKPNSSHLPDFPEAELELKVTGVRERASGFVAKERLVLTMIDFFGITDEEWEGSSLLGKCRLMLLMFYFYDPEVADIDRKFVLDPLLYRLDGDDVDVIRRDWELIRKKIREGKAHELSEGDTFYLGACRKGSGGPGEKLRKQPFAEIPAKARAFSLKQSYMTQIVQDHAAGKTRLVAAGQSIEDATIAKFAPYIGATTSTIAELLKHQKRDKNHKGFHRELAEKILGGASEQVVELAKAGVEMKTIRLKASGAPRESMSFPTFKYLEIVNENWEESNFFERLERKFLFVIFKEDSKGIERLEKVAYWNMPYSDRLEAQRVWEETKRCVAIDARNLPTSTESYVAHVRPKAQNANDTILTPQGELIVKKAFWLNSTYIGNVISNL